MFISYLSVISSVFISFLVHGKWDSHLETLPVCTNVMEKQTRGGHEGTIPDSSAPRRQGIPFAHLRPRVMIRFKLEKQEFHHLDFHEAHFHGKGSHWCNVNYDLPLGQASAMELL